MARWWKSSKTHSATVERKATLGVSDDLGAFLMFGHGGAASPTAALSLYEQSTAVSIPINMVVDAFSIAEPALLIGDEEMVRDHPLLDLIRNPSPWFTQELFLEVLGKNYLITGEAPLIALGNMNRPPLELQPMSPKSMTPVREQASDVATSWTVAGNELTGIYKATAARVSGRQAFRYLQGGLRELVVIRNYSTRDNSLLRGQSLLVAAAKEARQAILGTAHNVSLLENGGRVSLVFHFEEDLNDEQFEALKQRIRVQYGGATEAGNIGVTAGPKMSIQEMGVRPKDMDFGTLHQTASKAVALQYRVPLPLISDARQTLNNYQEGKLALYDDAVIPLARRVYGGLSDMLLPRFGLDPTKARLILDPDSVTALTIRRNNELKKRKDIAVETRNELRALLGREPSGPEADVHYQPANLVPVGTDLLTEDNDPEVLEPSLPGGPA